MNDGAWKVDPDFASPDGSNKMLSGSSVEVADGEAQAKWCANGDLRRVRLRLGCPPSSSRAPKR